MQELAEQEAVEQGPASTGLTCYLHPGWKPHLRPAAVKRDWMSAAPEAFAYRCLPLNMANAHGWELLSPCAFYACWLGGAEADHVLLRLPEGLTRQGFLDRFYAAGRLVASGAGVGLQRNFHLDQLPVAQRLVDDLSEMTSTGNRGAEANLIGNQAITLKIPL